MTDTFSISITGDQNQSYFVLASTNGSINASPAGPDAIAAKMQTDKLQAKIDAEFARFDAIIDPATKPALRTEFETKYAETGPSSIANMTLEANLIRPCLAISTVAAPTLTFQLGRKLTCGEQVRG